MVSEMWVYTYVFKKLENMRKNAVKKIQHFYFWFFDFDDALLELCEYVLT
jgi:hypothetical protein